MNTNIKDMNGKEIFVGNILVNPMIGDLWKVEFVNSKYFAYLIPSSGIIEHRNTSYPEYIEELEDVSDVFYIFELEYLGYKGSVGYDSVDCYYYGKLNNTTDLVTYNGDNPEELLQEFEIAVKEYLDLKTH